MSAPIKREDIRKGDRIRRSLTHEYTAACDGQTPLAAAAYEYELIERPVQLPDVPGWYLSGSQGDVDGILLLTLRGEWRWVGNRHDVSPEPMERLDVADHLPLSPLRPVAEIAARDWQADIDAATDTDTLTAIYTAARATPGAYMDELKQAFGVRGAAIKQGAGKEEESA